MFLSGTHREKKFALVRLSERSLPVQAGERDQQQFRKNGMGLLLFSPANNFASAKSFLIWRAKTNNGIKQRH
jgi:hypothetical protein